MPLPPKHLEIVAGPNGSGKTTFAQAYFRLRNGESRFINADTVAAGLSAGNESHAAFHAGRVVLQAIEEAIEEGESFAFESTLSGRTWVPILKDAKAKGYRITIYFLRLRSPSLNIRRVRERVKQGGHSIPKQTILRRHPRSLNNFWKVYRSLCDDWFIFDNSGNKPSEVLSRSTYESVTSQEQLAFERLFLRER